MQSLSDRARSILLSYYQRTKQGKLSYDMGLSALGLANLDWKRGVNHFTQILHDMGSGDLYTSKRTLLPPPLFGFLLAGFYELAPDEDSAISFLKSIYGKVMDFHRFLYRERDPEESGLLIITHPEEDLLLTVNEPAYDFRSSSPPEAIKYQDPLFNALLVWSNESLIEIGDMIGEDTTDVLLWNELTIFSITERLWREEKAVFQAFDLENQVPIERRGIAALMPLIGEIPDQDQAEMMLEVLKNDSLNYLLTPLPPEDKYAFPPDTQVSVIANWLLYHGLWRFGMSAAANKIRDFSLGVMERYGFRNIYDFSKGKPEFDPAVPEYLPVAGLCLAWLNEE